MNSVVIAKFGGSAIGVDGISIPIIIQRINSLSKNAKVVAVFSAPLTVVEGKPTSLTDVALQLGKRAEEGWRIRRAKEVKVGKAQGRREREEVKEREKVRNLYIAIKTRRPTKTDIETGRDTEGQK